MAEVIDARVPRMRTEALAALLPEVLTVSAVSTCCATGVTVVVRAARARRPLT